MPLNQSLKGKEYQEVSLMVERDQVLQFAEAIGEDAPSFRDPEAAKQAGHAEQVAPPTFVTKIQIMSSAQVVLDQDLGLNYMMVVHGEQEFEWGRPVVVGDTLTAVPRIADIYAKGPNEFLVIEAEVRDGSGEIVAVSRTTLLSRGTAER
ncbi:MAG TPA: MaoC family dehydratase N-terminal domain-containing protein [Actinomycetota bacterium]|jgi:acyl dehydratase|nr:MaoC family dehydratase N-terminal domain-containing protein [Actinomycetota bacterium]